MGLKRTYNKLKLKLGMDLGITDLGQPQLSFRPRKPFDFDDSQVVGLEVEVEVDRSISRRMVLSIVATGGLGNTTLAPKIYKRYNKRIAKSETNWLFRFLPSQEVAMKYFNSSDLICLELEGQFDCLAWLSISQKFNLNDLFREILYSIEPEMRKQNPPLTDDDIPVKIKSTLRDKRFLIILDDVWTTDLWKQLKIAIPDSNNMSCVIIITRFKDVANAADCNTEPYQLNYLNSNKSLALLFRKAFQQSIKPENYPLNLLEVAKRLTKKSGGLPLALVVLGGILSRRKRNYTAWRTMEETMDWHDEDGKKCSQVLSMSYENLPYELKPCFLYFAYFPEDYNISGQHITRMWMAEGFVPKDGTGTIEDRAEKCLEELVQRCLIQVTKKSWNGYCKYCA